MSSFDIREEFIGFIKTASTADEGGLKSLRRMVVAVVGTIGAKNFVTLTADILKNDFCIEGCNDMRQPLKRIFTISLEDLRQDLSKDIYIKLGEHPIHLLSADHRDNIERLTALDSALDKIGDVSNEGLRGIHDEFNSYHNELELHIKKEEEVLFPLLEARGMAEHPDSLKKEHKEFREILAEASNVFIDAAEKRLSPKSEGFTKFKTVFIPAVSNHIFRETHIFYPAALEFVTDKGEWNDVLKGFGQIQI